MHLVGFIIRIYHDARTPERQFITMHGHLNVNLSRRTVTWTSNLSRCTVTWTSNLWRCTVTWTSIYHDARSPERQFMAMHGHLNVTLSRCTVTWTSIYHDARSSERQFEIVSWISPFALFHLPTKIWESMEVSHSIRHIKHKNSLFININQLDALNFIISLF